MNIEELTFNCSELNIDLDQALRETLLPKLEGTVFHVTPERGLSGILEEKSILANLNGEFEYSFPQSRESYGVKNKRICLFDLRDSSQDIIDETLTVFRLLNPEKWDNYAYLILNEVAYGDLIPNETARNENNYDCIQNVEVWHPNPIPLEKFSKIIKVGIRNRPPPNPFN